VLKASVVFRVESLRERFSSQFEHLLAILAKRSNAFKQRNSTLQKSTTPQNFKQPKNSFK